LFGLAATGFVLTRRRHVFLIGVLGYLTRSLAVFVFFRRPFSVAFFRS